MANMQLNKTPMPEQDPVIRSANFGEVALGYTAEQAVNEAKRCINCKNPACVSGCPVGIPIPQFLSKVAEEDFAGAYEILSNANALPAISGRALDKLLARAAKRAMPSGKAPLIYEILSQSPVTDDGRTARLIFLRVRDADGFVTVVGTLIRPRWQIPD